MNSPPPHQIDPTGAPNPFEKQNVIESAGDANAETDTPSAVAALKMRAPSMWTDTPRSRALIESLAVLYDVRYNDGCDLITVRHFDEATLETLTAGKEVLVEQRSRSTARFVVK